MDLKDLKKTWDQYSSKENNKKLDETQIREMLRGRTRNLIEKIERNIRVGFLIIFAFIILFFIDDFIISPALVNDISNGLKIPQWILFLDIFTNFLIVTTFIFFVIRYYKVKKECDISCELPQTLKKIIDTLKLYQRLFYFAILVLVLSTATGFIAGLYKGVVFSAQEQGISISDIATGKWFLIVIIGLLALLLLTGSLYLLFRWGFRRLYGNYLQKLKLTLKELNEIE